MTMSVLITREEAELLVSGSEKRRNELIEQITKEIVEQSRKGLRWAHLPNGLVGVEEGWLIDQLILNGFDIKDTNPVINW